MPEAAAPTNPPASNPSTDAPIDGASAAAAASEKVIRMKHSVQEKAEALNGWAHDQARAIAGAAKDRPLATASVSAGTAFAAGLVLGLLLGRAAPPPRPSWRDRLMEMRPPW